MQHRSGRRLTRAIAIAILTGGTILGGASLADADEEGLGGPGGTGGGPIGAAPARENGTFTAKDSAKLALAELHSAYRAGRVPSSTYDKAVATFRTTYGVSALPELRSSKTGGVLESTATSRTLSVIQHDQALYYYCGPATAESIVEYLTSSPHSSWYDGATLSQAHLAGSNYLQTTEAYGTPWDGHRMPVALNRWVQGTTSGFYAELGRPTISGFKSALTFDIDQLHPFANSTVEQANDPRHYNHHPVSKLIGHWVPARGYSSSGARAAFADPAHSAHVSWGDLPAEYFTLDSGAWAAYYLAEHGIVW